MFLGGCGRQHLVLSIWHLECFRFLGIPGARRPSGPSYWGKGAKFGKLMNILILARVVKGGQEGQVVLEAPTGRAAAAAEQMNLEQVNR